jgi:hypothetical protein
MSANVGGLSAEPSWLDRLFKRILMSRRGCTLTEFGGFLPILVVSLFPVANALSEGSSELKPAPAVPSSPLGLAAIIFTAVIYTAVATFMSYRCETRTQRLLVFAFLQFLAYISFETQDEQWMWLLCLFL